MPIVKLTMVDTFVYTDKLITYHILFLSGKTFQGQHNCLIPCLPEQEGK